MFKQGTSRTAAEKTSEAQTAPAAVSHPEKRTGLLVRIVLCLGLASGMLGIISAVGDARRANGASTASLSTEPVPKYEVVINRPSGPPQIPTGTTNFQGQPVMASCSACHATTKPNLDTRRSEDLDQFHQGLKYAHGDLSCLSCHNSQNYETLRLADTRSLEFSDSMTLCSQCHGPQRRDYDMGLHGGMNGHWDLTRGGRTRNTCIDCHDPHAPAFPAVMPVLAPRDRVSVGQPNTDH